MVQKEISLPIEVQHHIEQIITNKTSIPQICNKNSENQPKERIISINLNKNTIKLVMKSQNQLFLFQKPNLIASKFNFELTKWKKV